MSLMGMREAFQKHGRPIWIFLALTLVISSFIGLGSYLTGAAGEEGPREEPIARVGDVDITRSSLDRRINQVMPNPTPLQLVETRLFLIEQEKQQQAVAVAAQERGIRVEARDIQQARDERWAQDRTGYVSGLQLPEGATDRELDRALGRTQTGLTVDYLRAQYPEAELRVAAYAEKLQAQFADEVRGQATPEQVRQSYSDVQVRHILIRFGEGERTEAEARKRAEELLAQVQANPEKMAELAREHSDDPGSQEDGGFYDWAPARRYVPEFSEAALSVQPNQVYPQVVRVSNTGYSGFHIVRLEGLRPGEEFPEDFDTNTQQYVDEYIEQRAQSRMQTAIAEALPNVRVELLDPTLRAAQLNQEAQRETDPKVREAKLNQALAELQNVPPESVEHAIAVFQRAAFLRDLGRTDEAVAAHEEALTIRNTVDTRIDLARLHLEKNNQAAAVEQIEQAEQLVRGDINEQYQIAMLYREAGQEQRAEAAEQKAMDMMMRQAAMQQQQQQQQPQQQPGHEGHDHPPGAQFEPGHEGHDHPPIPVQPPAAPAAAPAPQAEPGG